MKRILGIDTGTNSLGWAVVDRDENGQCSLVRKGSLIFQEGVKKNEKGKESSKAAERTEFRAKRRQYFRRRLRKVEVLKVLVKYGWCPYLSPEALHAWHVNKQYPMDEEFLQWQRTDDALDKNPYAYRHICLHDELDLDNEAERFILGRAMYHLAQRRGFKSNRRDQSEEDGKETGAVKEGINNLSEEMKAAGCEFLGDYFWHLYRENEHVLEGGKHRIRTRYTDRKAQYKKEFYAICEKQRLSMEQIAELERALYFHRRPQRHSVGKCTFEKKKPRCSDSHPAYELYRMLCFVNTIKVMGPYDVELRPLTSEEFEKIKPQFFKKGNKPIKFEDIAKALAGKNNYQYIKDAEEKPYKFNYRMTFPVSGCPTIASLISLFGDDYQNAIAEVYTLAGQKTKEQMVEDVWNVLYSFQDEENVKRWGMERLQLSDEEAEKFSKIRLSRNFASLSLSAIRRILPWLEQGLVYSRAVLMAKIPDIVGSEIWQEHGERIQSEMLEFLDNFNTSDEKMQGTLDFCIKDYLLSNFDLKPGAVDALYHPSMIEAYQDAKKNKDGVYQLGSPKTNSVRNPMAMRSLHKLRKVINMLLREKIIDQNTEVHIEYARELNDANKRWAIADWNKDREKARAKYAEEITKLYKAETGRDIVPTKEEILKYELWTEQNHICLYTGKEIGITDFIGPNPRFDIEHTVPRSVGGDSTKMNMTLCCSQFNRDVKKARLPQELSNIEDIMARLADWKEKITQLRKDADNVRTYSGMPKDMKDRKIRKRHKIRIELDYWQEKYRRFQMTEVPEGFSRRQGAGIGLVGKYAGLYLRSLFHKPEDRQKSNVRVVKGTATAEFRKMWGVQDEYEKKSRDNHIHHCIDAIVIACIQTGDYNAVARYYQQYEEYERQRAQKPTFPKPWPTFTEDIKALASQMLVVHDTPDNFAKHASKIVYTPTGKHVAQGDSVRGSLHKDTYYGAIERNGKIEYVVRRSLSSFKTVPELDSIVDEAVKEIVKKAVEGKNLKEALAQPIYMNKEKGILIKKVRCKVKSVNLLEIRTHRDSSRQEYKRKFYAEKGGNYCFAIYEGKKKGHIVRDKEIISTFDAAKYCRKSFNATQQGYFVPKEKNGLPLRCIIKTGTHIILLQDDSEVINVRDSKEIANRLYYAAILKEDGRIILRHHQEARKSTIIKNERKAGSYVRGEEYRAEISMSLSNFHALVEGEDFEINALGEITLKH